MGKQFDKVFLKPASTAKLMRPDSNHRETLAMKLSREASSSRYIAFHFSRPVCAIGLRHGPTALWTAVPKTAVDEDC